MGAAIVNKFDTWHALICGEDMAHFAYTLSWGLAHFATKCSLGQFNMGQMEHFDKKKSLVHNIWNLMHKSC